MERLGEQELKSDFERGLRNGCVGHVLVSETETVRVWHLKLQPGERIGFHTHVLDYFWTALSAGSAQSRIGGGAPVVVRYAPGDTQHLTYGAGESMTHDLENVGDTELAFVTVEFVAGANRPFEVPDSIRRGSGRPA